jgi:hypothetical protein
VGAETGIQDIVDRETRAWNTKDVGALARVFHPHMVWAWPASHTSYDPAEWRLVLGKFDAARWGSVYEQLFRTRTLIHNRRETVRIEVSTQGDGALAVVDMDTLWQENGTGVEDHWLGRTGKRCQTPISVKWPFDRIWDNSSTARKASEASSQD